MKSNVFVFLIRTFFYILLFKFLESKGISQTSIAISIVVVIIATIFIQTKLEKGKNNKK